MIQGTDTQYWQEQEQRADELRSILERTFAVAQARGLVQPLDPQAELWGYQSQGHTLVYAPETDVFWVAANEGEWRVNWQGQAPIADLNSEITLSSCRVSATQSLARSPAGAPRHFPSSSSVAGGTAVGAIADSASSQRKSESYSR